MQDKPHITTLSNSEQKALAICGLYKDEQIAAAMLQDLCRDVRCARESFPEQMEGLTEERMREIYSACCARLHVVAPEEHTDKPTEEDENKNATEHNRRTPELVISRHGRSKARHTAKKKNVGDKLAYSHSKEHCVHTIHPLRLYICAWFTILLYLDIIAWFIVPALIFMGYLPEVNEKLVLVVLVLGLCPYLFLSGKATCSVCNMRVFTARVYSRSRYAHHYPLLGTNLSTAIHIILFLWFCCPGCGTPQSLLRRSRKR